MEKDILLPVSEPRRSPSTFGPSKLKTFLAFFTGCCLFTTWLFGGCWSSRSSKQIESRFKTLATVRYEARAPTLIPTPTGVVDVFQVYQPVLTPSGTTDGTTSSDGREKTATIAGTESDSSCEVILMEHSFGFSYGIPFVGDYTPPKCKFNRVTWNFTVEVKGRQFDRLGLAYFGDTEIWRTSTAEPTVNGIQWTYIKDMTEYLYFWNSPQTLIFDLGNLIDSTYTGIFNTTLTATFFTSQDTVEPADLIVPISARKGSSNAPSLFTLPADNATNTIGFPRNANRAVFSVSACGQATEEFWWSNVLQSNIDTFDPVDGTLYGHSPFREVQVLIDGKLAGVHWPFPIIFTGGVVPGLWRPIVGIDAFDLREHEIDISPWLPVLSDGKQHTFEIRVVGLVDDGKHSATLTEAVGASWYVTGKIFVWLDSDPKSITSGHGLTIECPNPSISVSQKLTHDLKGANKTLEYTTNVHRDLTIWSLVTTEKGTRYTTWTQSLSVKNYGLYTAYGATQQNNQTTTGVDQSSGVTSYRSAYSYPLYALSTYLADPVSGNFTLDATIIRTLDLAVSGTPVFPTGLQPFAHLPQAEPLVASFTGTHLITTQNGTAHYFASPSAGLSTGHGSTGQVFRFRGTHVGGDSLDEELYFRDVAAVNLTVVRDRETLVGVEVGGFEGGREPGQQVVMGTAVGSPKQSLGRGPGRVKQVLAQGG